MKRKMLCLLAALMVCAVFPAAAEEPQPVTAAELDAMLESVRTQALSSELLNDPTGEEAQSEDGTLFQYDFTRLYAAATTLAEDTALNAAVYEDSEGPVFRGLGIDSMQEELLAAFPNENADLAGTRDEALLFLKDTEKGGFVYGRLLRAGPRAIAVEYGEVLPEGEDFRRSTVTFVLQDGLVASIRVDGPGSGQIDASQADELRAELQELGSRDEYRAVKTSRNGKDLEPFGESDLVFSGFSYTELQPSTLPGEPEREMFDNGDGTSLMRCEGPGYEAVFSCDENGDNAKILSFSILDEETEGPRCVRLGDLFHEDFMRFRSEDNEMTEDMTELLYGEMDGENWGFASYDPSDGETSLRYVTTTKDGLQVQLILRYVENYLMEIMLQTL